MKKLILNPVFIFVSLGLIFGAIYAYNNGQVQAASSGPKATAELMIEAENGQHGPVFKFYDGFRTCYFNGSGGIWCTQ